jgi:hypothetical protein
MTVTIEQFVQNPAQYLAQVTANHPLELVTADGEKFVLKTGHTLARKKFWKILNNILVEERIAALKRGEWAPVPADDVIADVPDDDDDDDGDDEEPASERIELSPEDYALVIEALRTPNPQSVEQWVKAIKAWETLCHE